MMAQLYVDLDGVLADFDGHFRALFGRAKHDGGPQEDDDWAKVRASKTFYRDMPPMRDMKRLWKYIAKHDPCVLTGIPKSMPEQATINKLEWCKRHVPEACVITCLSAEKSLYCEPGDILIDDWERYKGKWEAKGGIWVTHTSAQDTIDQLRRMGL